MSVQPEPNPIDDLRDLFDKILNEPPKRFPEDYHLWASSEAMADYWHEAYPGVTIFLRGKVYPKKESGDAQKDQDQLPRVCG